MKPLMIQLSTHRAHRNALTFLTILTVTACERGTPDMNATTTQASSTTPAASISTEEAVRRVSTRRVYFAHQSVGHNVLTGLESMLTGADSTLKIVKTREPATVSGPAVIHFEAGRNEDPASKNADFIRMLDARPTRDQGVAMMKYCFLDVNFGTDVKALFDTYRQTIAQVKAKHPDVTIVHVTMPLTVDATGAKAGIKRMLGRPTARDLNLKRNQFNAMLKAEFGREPIFDIAELESTLPDGRREQATLGGETVYAMAPAYTYDGGHLTPEASRRFAESFLKVVASTPIK